VGAQGFVNRGTGGKQCIGEILHFGEGGLLGKLMTGTSERIADKRAVLDHELDQVAIPSIARAPQPIVPDICTVLDHELGQVSMPPNARSTQSLIPVIRAVLDHELSQVAMPSSARTPQPPVPVVRAVLDH